MSSFPSPAGFKLKENKFNIANTSILSTTVCFASTIDAQSEFGQPQKTFKDVYIFRWVVTVPERVLDKLSKSNPLWSATVESSSSFSIESSSPATQEQLASIPPHIELEDEEATGCLLKVKKSVEWRIKFDSLANTFFQILYSPSPHCLALMPLSNWWPCFAAMAPALAADRATKESKILFVLLADGKLHGMT